MKIGVPPPLFSGLEGGSPGAMRRETERLGAATQPFSNPHSEDNDDLF